MRRTDSATRFICIVVGVAAICAIGCDTGRGARAPTAAVSVDTSKHQVAFITVVPGVRLEVLDWGGAGPPLVFLAGQDDVAHGFDDFAPRFTDKFHVLAITRRGFGASTQTASGYDVATRVADLRSALDSLRLPTVTLAGHSRAGDELTGFAVAFPTRAVRLVYLEAAYDHTDHSNEPTTGVWPPPQARDSASAAALRAFETNVWGYGIPIGQILATEVFDSTGRLLRDVTPASIDSLLVIGAGHPDYAHVQAPALAIYTIRDSAPQLYAPGAWRTLSDSNKAIARAYLTRWQGMAARQRALFRTNIPHGQILELHGASHYIFFSHSAEVERAMRAFLTPNFPNSNVPPTRHSR